MSAPRTPARAAPAPPAELAAPAADAAAAAPDAAPRLSHARAAVALSLLLGLQPVTTDIVLPAMPAFTRALGASMTSAQLTMSALILAFGVAQLVWGPVADRIGRRPVLVTGLVLYTVASVGGALAGSIEALIVWRTLQGATMAAAVVCARAMLRDLYAPHEGAQVMSLALSGLGVIAVAGPVVGGLAAAAWGWRGAFAVVAAAGALTLAFVALRLPETLRNLNPRATRPGPLGRTWWRIARDRTFVAWTLLVSTTYGGLFTILAGSSFVYIEVLGMTPGGYGLAMASASGSYLAGTLVCRRWIASRGIVASVQRGAVFTLVGGALMVGGVLAGVDSVWAVLLPQWLYTFGHGIHQPCGQAGAVGPFPAHAGAASALAGFVLALTAFVVGLWLGRALDGTLAPFVWGVGFWSVATTAVAWILVPRVPPAQRAA